MKVWLRERIINRVQVEVELPIYRKIESDSDTGDSVTVEKVTEKYTLSITHSNHWRSPSKYSIDLKYGQPSMDGSYKDEILGLGQFSCSESEFDACYNEALHNLVSAYQDLGISKKEEK